MHPGPYDLARARDARGLRGSSVVSGLLALVLAGCSPSGKATPKESPSPAASASGIAGAARPLPSPIPDIVARVNGEAIRLAQLVPAARRELRRPAAGEPERQRAEALRRALEQYVDRELLLQEALARGVAADDRAVQWSYDQMRREHADDAAWAAYLAADGLDPQSLRAELRVRQTIDSLLASEARAQGTTLDQARAALVAQLRGRARIELYL